MGAAVCIFMERNSLIDCCVWTAGAVSAMYFAIICRLPLHKFCFLAFQKKKSFSRVLAESGKSLTVMTVRLLLIL